MSIPRDYYAPSPDQLLEIKRRAADMRGRVKALRSLREVVGSPRRQKLDLDIDERATIANEFRGMGWPDTDAAELAEIHVKLRDAP